MIIGNSVFQFLLPFPETVILFCKSLCLHLDVHPYGFLLAVSSFISCMTFYWKRVVKVVSFSNIWISNFSRAFIVKIAFSPIYVFGSYAVDLFLVLLFCSISLRHYAVFLIMKLWCNLVLGILMYLVFVFLHIIYNFD